MANKMKRAFIMAVKIDVRELEQEDYLSSSVPSKGIPFAEEEEIWKSGMEEGEGKMPTYNTSCLI